MTKLPDIVMEWVKKAEEDYKFASIILEEEKEFYDHICFNFQQSAEKYLKSYMIANKLPFVKTHDLLSLLSLCQKKDQAFYNLHDSCEYLTEFYVEARYPTFWEGKTDHHKAYQASLEAKKIRDYVRKKLSIE